MRTRRTARARGMTLIEILIVVAIMSLVAGGVAMAVIGQLESTKIRAATIDARAIRNAVKASWAVDDQRQCPTVARLIDMGVLDEGSATIDPWGQRWRIACDGHRITVGSAGRDRKFGTEDDIRVPPLERKEPTPPPETST